MHRHPRHCSYHSRSNELVPDFFTGLVKFHCKPQCATKDNTLQTSANTLTSIIQVATSRNSSCRHPKASGSCQNMDQQLYNSQQKA